MKVIKGKSVNGVSQQPCPHYFKSYDVRIGSTWCKRCKFFVGYSTTRGEHDHLTGTYDIEVKCNAE